MTEIIIAVISSGIFSSIATHWFTKRKTQAEADSTSADAMTKAIEGSVDWASAMRQDIDSLRRELQDVQNKYIELVEKYRQVLEENHSLKQEVDALRRELRAYENDKIFTTKKHSQ